MSALHSVAEPGASAVGELEILDYTLARERRFWRDIAAAREVPAILYSGLDLAMAAITMRGGATNKADAIAVIGAFEFFSGQPFATISAVAEVLHEACPGDYWIHPIEPDLLGEHLVQRVTDDEAAMNQLFDVVLRTASVDVA
jgi:hypothetical protein